MLYVSSPFVKEIFGCFTMLNVLLYIPLVTPGLASPSRVPIRVDNTVPMVTQPPSALQLQPQLIAGQQVPQQLLPVSMIEQNGRQMLLAVSFDVICIASISPYLERANRGVTVWRPKTTDCAVMATTTCINAGRSEPSCGTEFNGTQSGWSQFGGRSGYASANAAVVGGRSMDAASVGGGYGAYGTRRCDGRWAVEHGTGTAVTIRVDARCYDSSKPEQATQC